MTTIGIIGRGSHGKACAEVAHALGWSVAWYDDNFTAEAAPVESIPEPQGWVIGINNSQTRAEIAPRIQHRPTRLVHPTVIRGEGIVRGLGSVIAAGCILTTDVRIGLHTHLNVGATVSQGSWLGDYVTVSPGAHITGEVTIGDRTMIGAGAVIKNLITIGADVTVGCGAVVVDDIPAGETVVGVPARPLVRS